MIPVNAAAGGAAAAAAAAEAARREEEEMTTYDRTDVDGDWEFKILRSTTGVFRDREKLQRILEEEARAGWELVEKFDNQRVRLKRRTSHRENDDLLEFDAYRTHAGMSEAKLALVILGTIFGVLTLGGIIIALAVG